jgi:sulfur-carrier protein
MNITVKYFGLIADITSIQEEIVSLENTKGTTAELTAILFNKYKEFKDASFVIALNRRIVVANTTLKDNDVIALLPPFAGG